jgi:hypothetical protein
MLPQWSQQLINLVFFALICIRQEGGNTKLTPMKEATTTT